MADRQQWWSAAGRALAVTGTVVLLAGFVWLWWQDGYAVARAYAGHAGQGAGGELGTTFTYVKATLGEVATAVGALTSEPHPLAETTEEA